MQFRLFAMLVAVCLLGACSSLPPSATSGSQDAALQDCATWFQRLDAAVDQWGVRDAEAHRLPGYPHLRSDRLLASFADDTERDKSKLPDWLRAMRDLDQRSREAEIRNLPAASLPALGMPDKTVLRTETARCGNALIAANLSVVDAEAADAQQRLAIAARVPDNYSSTLRAFGLYPLVSIPFLDGVQRWQQRTAAEFERQRTQPRDAANVIRYVPRPTHPDPDLPRLLLARVERNALGIPQFSDAQRNALLDAHAPIFEVNTFSDDDRIGAFAWQRDDTLAVEPSQPAVYRRVAFTRFGREVRTQLVYTAWFPRRTSEGTFDPLAGEFDGVILRITLDGEGNPLIADSIHACGCYHLFFPGPHTTLRLAPEAHLEWAFTPAPLPALAPGARILLQLASGTHYVTGIDVAGKLDGVRYAAMDENDLRALAAPGHATRSIYSPDGLIDASKRGERFLFWPMGIASPGAMRQWGNHATAFVGRRHFDDADLLEKRFSLTGE